MQCSVMQARGELIFKEQSPKFFHSIYGNMHSCFFIYMCMCMFMHINTHMHMYIKKQLVTMQRILRSIDNYTDRMCNRLSEGLRRKNEALKQAEKKERSDPLSALA